MKSILIVLALSVLLLNYQCYGQVDCTSENWDRCICDNTQCIGCTGNSWYNLTSDGNFNHCCDISCGSCSDYSDSANCDSCSSGYYLQQESQGVNRCLSCDVLNNCQECSDNQTCSQCEDGFYLDQNNQCQSCSVINGCYNCHYDQVSQQPVCDSCTELKALNPLDQSCQDCSNNCQQCSYDQNGDQYCQNCENSAFFFFIDENQQEQLALNQDPQGNLPFYRGADKNTCTQCPQNCDSCYYDGDIDRVLCLSCENSNQSIQYPFSYVFNRNSQPQIYQQETILNQNQQQQVQGQEGVTGYYLDHQQQCQACPQNCLLCEQNNGSVSCLQAAQGYVINAQNQLEACNGCTACELQNSLVVCTECAQGEFLNKNNVCTPNPEPNTDCHQDLQLDNVVCDVCENYDPLEDDHLCGSCLPSNQYVLVNNVCQQCPQLCQTCSAGSNQIQCDSCIAVQGYELDTEHGCCPTGCETCTLENGQFTCQSCTHEYRLNDPANNCQDGSPDPLKLLECQPHMYKKSVDAFMTCLDCPENCDSCEFNEVLDDVVCLSCLGTHELNGNDVNRCVGGSNESCNHPCLTCGSNPDICDTCVQGLKRKDAPLCGCIEGHFENNFRECEQCQFPCEECEGSEYNCTVCAGQFRDLSTNCACMNGYTENSERVCEQVYEQSVVECYENIIELTDTTVQHSVTNTKTNDNKLQYDFEISYDNFELNLDCFTQNINFNGSDQAFDVSAQKSLEFSVLHEDLETEGCVYAENPLDFTWTCEIQLEVQWNGIVQFQYTFNMIAKALKTQQNPLEITMETAVADEDETCCENPLDIETSIQMCETYECVSFNLEDYVFERQEDIFFQVTIDTPEFQTYYLNNLSVKFGELNLSVMNTNNSNPGKIIYHIKSQLALGTTTITVISQLQHPSTKGLRRRFLGVQEDIENGDYKIKSEHQIKIVPAQLYDNTQNDDNDNGGNDGVNEKDLQSQFDDGQKDKEKLMMILIVAASCVVTTIIIVLMLSYLYKKFKVEKKIEIKAERRRSKIIRRESLRELRRNSALSRRNSRRGSSISQNLPGGQSTLANIAALVEKMGLNKDSMSQIEQQQQQDNNNENNNKIQKENPEKINEENESSSSSSDSSSSNSSSSRSESKECENVVESLRNIEECDPDQNNVSGRKTVPNFQTSMPYFRQKSLESKENKDDIKEDEVKVDICE